MDATKHAVRIIRRGGGGGEGEDKIEEKKGSRLWLFGDEKSSKLELTLSESVDFD